MSCGAFEAVTAQVDDKDERRLIALVQGGDVAAFDTLVRRYQPRAMAIARRLLGDVHDAEDLVQDAFLRALDRISTFDTERAFGPWFFRLLVNTGLNARKSRALRRTEPEALDVASGEDPPDSSVERAEIRQRLAAALRELPPRQRAVVTMFEVDGLTSAEVGEALGIAPETVRWHLHEARRALRVALGPLRP